MSNVKSLTCRSGHVWMCPEWRWCSPGIPTSFSKEQLPHPEAIPWPFHHSSPTLAGPSRSWRLTRTPWIETHRDHRRNHPHHPPPGPQTYRKRWSPLRSHCPDQRQQTCSQTKCSQTRPTSEKEIVPDTWSMYLFYSIGKSINSGKVWRVVLRIFIPDPGHWQGSLWEKMHSLPPRQRALAKRISALARSGRFAKSPRSGSGPRPPPRLNMIDWGLHRSEEWVRSGRRWNSGFDGVAG